MGKTQRMTVTLMGGAPWGFRLIGGGALPLTINKIRKKSMAHNLGLQTGDAVLSINGVAVHDKSQDEAIDMMDKCGKSLKLEIFRGDISEMNTIEDKPKKPIWAKSQTEKTVTTSDDGSTTITTKTTSTTQSTTEMVSGPGETILISSDGGVSSEAFQNAVDQAHQGLQLSFTEGEVSSSAFESSNAADASTGLQLSFDVGDVSSNAYEQQSHEVVHGGLQLSFTEGDTSTNTFHQSAGDDEPVFQVSFTEGETSTNAAEPVDSGDFQLSFSTSEEVSSAPTVQSSGIAVDDFVISTSASEVESSQVLEDSGIQLDMPMTSIESVESSEVNIDGRILPIQLAEDDARILPIQIEAEAAPVAVMATPFVDSTVIAEEAALDFSPLKEPYSSTKLLISEPEIINTEPPKSLSPQPPPQLYSAPSPQPTVVLAEPEVSQPLQAAEIKFLAPSPAPASNTVTTSSQESFDDGQTRRQITTEQHVTTSEDGLSSRTVRQETSSTSFSTKPAGFVQSQESAFTSFQPAIPAQVTQIHASIGSVEHPARPAPPAEVQVSSVTMQSVTQAQPTAQEQQQFTTKYQPVQAPKPKYQAPAQTTAKYQPVATPQKPYQPPPQSTYQPPPQPAYQPPQQPAYQPPPQKAYQPPPQPAYQPPPQPAYQPPTPPKPQPKPQPTPQPQQQYATLPKPTRPQPPTTISSSYSTNSLDRNMISFRPSKFVPGFSNREIPGLYAPNSPKVEVDINTPSDLYHMEKPKPLAPMFQVRNFVAPKSKQSFKPNMWLPGQKPPSRQPSRAATPSESCMDESVFSKDFETFPVPKMKKENRLTIAQRKDALLNQPMHIARIDDFKNYIDNDEDLDDGQDEDLEYHQQPFDRTHLFAPPVEIHARQAPDDLMSPEGDEDEYEYYYEDQSPTSSLLRRKKAQYSDSAFYDTPGKHYPTIDEQMKLCKAISASLTSAANRRARGAKMFLRRKKKANKWVHEGEPGWSSAGDCAELHELDSELHLDDGGSKPLFYFKIPNLKTRVHEGSPNKMSLSQDQFERLRLSAKKCDHRQVAPEASFDIANDLKNRKGRGGRLFEKRRERADKYVIDNEHHLRGQDPKGRLENVLTQPIAQKETPWEAAAHHAGNVEPAFEHLAQMERNQKLNQYMKISTPRKHPTVQPVQTVQMPPMPPVVHTSLKGGSASLIKGKDFNRSARGWIGGGEYPVADSLTHVNAPKGAALSENFGDYNNKVRAWQGPGHTPYVNSHQAGGAAVRATSQHQAVPAPVRASQPPHGYTQQQHQADYFNYRNHPEWQAHDPEMEQLRQQQSMTPSYSSSSHFEHMPTAARSRPASGYAGSTAGHDTGSTSGGRGAYGTTYKEEYGYNYVPVDNKYGSLGSAENSYSADYNSFSEVKPMYMQPIIPGTDL